MKRAPNFSVEEVDILLKIIETRRNIIDCKKTDKVSIERKDKAWKLIAAEFNAKSSSVPYRNVYTLKKKHENLKKVLKKRLPQESRAMYDDSMQYLAKPFIRTTESDHKLSNEINGSEDLYSIEHNTQNLLNLTCCDNIFKDEEMKMSIASIGSSPLRSNQQLEDLRTPSDEEVTTSINKNYITKLEPLTQKENPEIFEENDAICKFSWAKMANDKAKWAEEKLKTEIHILRKEHEQRMQFMREKHNIEMRILQNELTKSQLFLDQVMQ